MSWPDLQHPHAEAASSREWIQRAKTINWNNVLIEQQMGHNPNPLLDEMMEWHYSTLRRVLRAPSARHVVLCNAGLSRQNPNVLPIVYLRRPELLAEQLRDHPWLKEQLSPNTLSHSPRAAWPLHAPSGSRHLCCLYSYTLKDAQTTFLFTGINPQFVPILGRALMQQFTLRAPIHARSSLKCSALPKDTPPPPDPPQYYAYLTLRDSSKLV